MKAIIHSTKHQTQVPFNGITTGARENILICKAVESTVANLVTEIEEGANIKAVFVEMWLQNDGNDGHQIVILEKVQTGLLGANFSNMGNLFAYQNKKNILFTHQGLSSNESIGNPQRIIGQWVKIPKSKQRFGLGDSLVMTISNPSSGNLNRCGIFIFKEYT